MEIQEPGSWKVPFATELDGCPPQLHGL